MERLSCVELRELYFRFFAEKGHAILPSASLIPENDHSVLFTNSGMHPLMDYLAGNTHPNGKRLVNIQKVIRTGAIDRVGEASFCTFFELLGNWSLGDYSKDEAIRYAWEFLTGEQYLNFPANRLAMTCFGGSESLPPDEQSLRSWLNIGIAPNRIFLVPTNRKGPYGRQALSGVNTKVFWDSGKEPCSENCNPLCSCGKYTEIWDIVFFEYRKDDSGKIVPLIPPRVDTGMGIERVAALTQGVDSVYETDSFADMICCIKKSAETQDVTQEEQEKAARIIADHIRCAVFILGDDHNIVPSNKRQGYILRRIIRRALRYALKLHIPEQTITTLVKMVILRYGDYYPELQRNQSRVISEIDKETIRFSKVLKKGIAELEKIFRSAKDCQVDSHSVLKLFDTFGFPMELTQEISAENGYEADVEGAKLLLSSRAKT